jgi:hypothetical protein
MKLHLSKHELDNTKKSGGLEITIDGIQGDPAEKAPGTSVYWNGMKARCSSTSGPITNRMPRQSS